jgi:hypothetical protein
MKSELHDLLVPTTAKRPGAFLFATILDRELVHDQYPTESAPRLTKLLHLPLFGRRCCYQQRSTTARTTSTYHCTYRGFSNIPVCFTRRCYTCLESREYRKSASFGWPTVGNPKSPKELDS